MVAVAGFFMASVGVVVMIAGDLVARLVWDVGVGWMVCMVGSWSGVWWE